MLHAVDVESERDYVAIKLFHHPCIHLSLTQLLTHLLSNSFTLFKHVTVNVNMILLWVDFSSMRVFE